MCFRMEQTRSRVERGTYTASELMDCPILWQVGLLLRVSLHIGQAHHTAYMLIIDLHNMGERGGREGRMGEGGREGREVRGKDGGNYTVGMSWLVSPYPNVVCVILQCFLVLKNRARLRKSTPYVQKCMTCKGNIPVSQTVAGGGGTDQTAQVPAQTTTEERSDYATAPCIRPLPQADHSHKLTTPTN